jgi:hypothetical protein
MPVELHERLSEFSYGFGVTREAEGYLRSVGLRTTPFLPSLIHEASIGCDVAFQKPGALLLLQFKLGQQLSRYRREYPGQLIPFLSRPFWRFAIDTLEVDGQFDLLRKAERSSAEVYYVAPKFAQWDEYATYYQSGQVLTNSLMVAPSQIDDALSTQGAPDGPHSVLYDQSVVHVRSDPVGVEPLDARLLAGIVAEKVRTRSERTSEILARVFHELETTRSVREPDHGPTLQTRRQIIRRLAIARQRRFQQILSRARSTDDAHFAALGMESWALGAQLVVVTES